MSTLETGPFCAECQVHRVQAPGTKCPVCKDRERNARLLASPCECKRCKPCVRWAA